MKNLLTSAFEFVMKPFYSAKSNLQEAANAEKALETKLTSATGIDGVLDVIAAEKKSRKEKEERRAARESLLNI